MSESCEVKGTDDRPWLEPSSTTSSGRFANLSECNKNSSLPHRNHQPVKSSIDSYKLELLNDYEDDVTDNAGKSDYINICAMNLAMKMRLSSEEENNDQVEEVVADFSRSGDRGLNSSSYRNQVKSASNIKCLQSGSAVNKKIPTEFTTRNLFRNKNSTNINDTLKREFKKRASIQSHGKYMTMSQANLFSNEKESRLFDFFNTGGNSSVVQSSESNGFHSNMRSKSEGKFC
jgi:hypothetical protein